MNLGWDDLGCYQNMTFLLVLTALIIVESDHLFKPYLITYLPIIDTLYINLYIFYNSSRPILSISSWSMNVMCYFFIFQCFVIGPGFASLRYNVDNKKICDVSWDMFYRTSKLSILCFSRYFYICLHKQFTPAILRVKEPTLWRLLRNIQIDSLILKILIESYLLVSIALAISRILLVYGWFVHRHFWDTSSLAL